MKWKISMSILWLMFTVLFFLLAGLHYAESKQVIAELEVTPIPSSMDIKFGKASLRETLGNFAHDFNNYLANQNKSNLKANLYACNGYFLAGLTALVSMVLVWQEYIPRFWLKFVLLVKKARYEQNKEK